MDRRVVATHSARILVGLAVSVFAQVCGFAASVLIIYVVIVPQSRLTDGLWQRTICYVDDIAVFDVNSTSHSMTSLNTSSLGDSDERPAYHRQQPSHYYSTKSPRTTSPRSEEDVFKAQHLPTLSIQQSTGITIGSGESGKLQKLDGRSAGPEELCLVVDVKFKATDHMMTWEKATLHLTEQLKKLRCFCTDCAVTITPTDSSVTVYVPHHVSPDMTFTLGDTINCFISVPSSTVRSAWKNLVAILISSSVFILGFVGTFLSAVHWEKIKENQRHQSFELEGCSHLDD